MDEAEKQTNTITKRKKRNRKLRLFLYGLLILLFMLIIPAVIIPPWLASKGIEINAVSGINFSQGLMINEVSIAINKNALTFRNLSLEHFVDEDSAISNASWRLFSQQTEVRLSPAILKALSEQDIRLGTLSFTDIAFNFTDLSAPYIFSAHSSQVSAALFDKNNRAIKQQIKDINLVLSTQPSLVITGFIRFADLSLLIPGDISENRYPFSLENANFSISWQPQRTPLSVHIENLTPKWPTRTSGYPQSGKNIALEIDLNRATESIKLTADHLWLDQPSQLPEFIKRPDDTNQGLHLGRTIGNLSLLPLKKLKIEDFSYGTLLLHSQLLLESPQGKQARLKLAGKALGPEPYDIDVTLLHLSEQNAHFAGEITGPNGNNVKCNADFRFISPLPQSLSCKVNFNNTKDLTDRLKLPGIPSATLHAPIILSANQVKLTPNVSRQASVNKANRASLLDIAYAEYQITLTLPNKVDLSLNQFAFHHPILSASETEKQPVSTLAFNTDGSLDLYAQYQNNTLAFKLAAPAEQISMTSPQHNSQLSLALQRLLCELRLDVAKLFDSLQCHTNSHLQGKISQLFPASGTKLEAVSASTDITFNWSASELDLQLHNTLLTLDKATLSPHPTLINAEATELTLNVAGIQLVQRSSPGKPSKLNLQLLPDSAISLHSNFYAEKIILDEAQPDNRQYDSKHASSQQQTRRRANQQHLPVQKYQGRLESELTDFSLSQAGERRKLNTQYQVNLTLKQNDQRLPSLGINGQINLTPTAVTASGELNNMRQAKLARFTAVYNLQQQKAKFKLHRNDIHFNLKQTLQKHYLPNLPVDYDLNNGTISFNADFLFHQNLFTGQLGIFTRALSGHIHGFHFADLNAAFTAEITPNGIRSKSPVGIHIGLLHAGVLLENLITLMEFDTENGFYALHRASAHTLGGSISTHGVKSNQLTNIPELPVIVHQLDLEKLIQAIEPEGVELTGILDGHFPISIEDGMPVIKNATLHSRYPGGILRYKEGSDIDQNIEAAGENSLLVISKILKNYKYDSLSVDIDYSKEGQLNASSRFRGYNPDFQNGRPVNLNLNIEDDIPALIKTLNVINSSKLESLFLKQLGINE